VRILILMNAPVSSSQSRWSDEAISDRAVEEVADTIKGALGVLGHTSSLFAVGACPGLLLQKIKRWKPDIVFNLCESLLGNSRLEPAVPYLLSWLGLPFTGNPAEVFGWALDKIHAKRLLRAAGFPTPDFRPLRTDDDLKGWNSFPAILKPAAEDASLGIDNGSVVENSAEALARFRLLKHSFGTPVLIESFIDGREINVALLETETGIKTGINEIDFSAVAADQPRILTYEAKWIETSAACQATPVKAGVTLSPGLDDRLRRIATGVFEQLHLQGYARIDFRIDHDEQPGILEINPNPDFSTTGGFARSLPEMGVSYVQAVQIMLNMAMKHQQKG
jgi:D-alanine-D-alanine ligase